MKRKIKGWINCFGDREKRRISKRMNDIYLSRSQHKAKIFSVFFPGLYGLICNFTGQKLQDTNLNFWLVILISTFYFAILLIDWRILFLSAGQPVLFTEMENDRNSSNHVTSWYDYDVRILTWHRNYICRQHYSMNNRLIFLFLTLIIFFPENHYIITSRS